MERYTQQEGCLRTEQGWNEISTHKSSWVQGNEGFPSNTCPSRLATNAINKFDGNRIAHKKFKIYIYILASQPRSPHTLCTPELEHMLYLPFNMHNQNRLLVQVFHRRILFFWFFQFLISFGFSIL